MDSNCSGISSIFLRFISFASNAKICSA